MKENISFMRHCSPEFLSRAPKTREVRYLRVSEWVILNPPGPFPYTRITTRTPKQKLHLGTRELIQVQGFLIMFTLGINVEYRGAGGILLGGQRRQYYRYIMSQTGLFGEQQTMFLGLCQTQYRWIGNGPRELTTTLCFVRHLQESTIDDEEEVSNPDLFLGVGESLSQKLYPIV
jgi:hypothetical protein